MSTEYAADGHDIDIITDADGNATAVTIDGQPLHLAGLTGITRDGDRPESVTVELVARTLNIRGNTPVVTTDD